MNGRRRTMSTKPIVVDKKRLHELFLSGAPLTEIAKEFGSTLGSIRTMIYQERQRDPYKWPHRINPSISTDPPLMMHFYECDDCFVSFAIEDYEEVDLSVATCPICGGDDGLKKKGYGRFVRMKDGPS